VEVSPATRLPGEEESELLTKVIGDERERTLPSIPTNEFEIVKDEIVMLLILVTFVVKTTTSPFPTISSLSVTISELVITFIIELCAEDICALKKMYESKMNLTKNFNFFFVYYMSKYAKLIL